MKDEQMLYFQWETMTVSTKCMYAIFLLVQKLFAILSTKVAI